MKNRKRPNFQLGVSFGLGGGRTLDQRKSNGNAGEAVHQGNTCDQIIKGGYGVSPRDE